MVEVMKVVTLLPAAMGDEGIYTGEACVAPGEPWVKVLVASLSWVVMIVVVLKEVVVKPKFLSASNTSTKMNRMYFSSEYDWFPANYEFENVPSEFLCLHCKQWKIGNLCVCILVNKIDFCLYNVDFSVLKPTI